MISSWPRPPSRPQSFGSASALASNIWPRSAAEEPAAENGPICLHFTSPTTGHHTMIDDGYCARENEKSTLAFWS